MNRFEEIKQQLRQSPKKWVVTGVAGFIGSNLLENLLELDQTVVGFDNFATGHRHNLQDVESLVTNEQWSRFRFHEGDICSLDECREVVDGADYVLHQAALGSVPRSMKDPLTSNASNVDGFLNMLVAARDSEVKSFVYAASSSTYGDHPDLPKVEDRIGNPLSPYAVTKLVNELYADVFSRSYEFHSIGLRYFNVFGKRQDPNGAYAAVIPKWIQAFLDNEPVTVNGDGSTTRDFCYIDNVVQANILAATSEPQKASVYNVAVGDRTSLVELHKMIFEGVSAAQDNGQEFAPPIFGPFRPGDVLHSQASIDKIQGDLSYTPQVKVGDGILRTCKWFTEASKR